MTTIVIGIVPGQDFDAAKLDAAVAKGLQAAPKAAQQRIISYFKGSAAAGDAALTGGWTYSTKTGVYDTDEKTPLVAFWLDDDLPHHRKWRGESPLAS